VSTSALDLDFFFVGRFEFRFRRPGFFFCRPASWTFCLCRLASWISSSVGRLFGYFSFIGRLLGYLVRLGVKFRNEASFFFVFFSSFFTKRLLTFHFSFFLGPSASISDRLLLAWVSFRAKL